MHLSLRLAAAAREAAHVRRVIAAKIAKGKHTATFGGEPHIETVQVIKHHFNTYPTVTPGGWSVSW
jgi:hypothetical protein